jgi:ABC-2 type transport system permease protein
MLSNVFLKSLRDQRKPLLWWSIGLIAIAIFTMAFYPSIRDAPGLDDMFEQMPEVLRKVFLGAVADLTSPEGYLNSQLYVFFAPVLFLFFTIGRGSWAIAGEEQNGTLDLLLSYPVMRWRVVVDKFLAMTVATLGLVMTLWLGTVAGIVMVGMEISLLRVAEVTLSAGLLGMAFGSLALAVGCATGKRSLSIGVASAVAVLAYFWNALAPSVDVLEPFRKVSPFYYYSGADPLTNGLDPGHVAVLVGITVVLLALGIVAFRRRDLAV